MEEMPLVKGTQQKYGKNKLQVLLLSVDRDYDMPMKEIIEGDTKRMQHQKVADWPNVVLPNGCQDTQRLFNLDGYGLTLIGPDGIVRGIHLQPEEVESMLADMFKS
jgi:hypothetical protein